VTDFGVQRIIVACDAVTENRSGIETAAKLAALWNALLHAVFVQDESLLHLAAFPFIHQIGTAGVEELDESSIQRYFETDTMRARATVKAAAQRHAVSSSFSVVRGQPTLAALSVGDHDMLVMAATSRPFAGRFRLASRWLVAALEVQYSVLLLRNHHDWSDGVVCIIQSNAPSMRRSLTAAAELSAASGRRLFVRIVDNAASVSEVLSHLDDVWPDRNRKPAIESVSRDAALDEGENSLLVVDAAPAVSSAASLKRLIENSQADILFVR